MYSADYQLGLDRSVLTDPTRIRFFDIDGVLSVYAYGIDGINAVSDQEFDRFVESVDLYQSAEGPDFLRQYMFQYSTPSRNYVVSQSGTMTQDAQKRRFIKRLYFDCIPEDHVFFTRTSDKASIIKEILSHTENGLSTPHLAIDDDVRVLDILQREQITAVHISSLLLLADLHL